MPQTNLHPSDKDQSTARLKWSLLIVTTVAAFILGIASWIVWDSAQAGPVLPVTDASASPQGSFEFVRERLDLYDRRARDVQWLVGALLAAGAIFVLLQGVFAFLSVQNFNTQIETGLRRATEATQKIDSSREQLENEFRKQMEVLAQEMRRQFPLAAKMEDALEEALRLLDLHFQDANWYDKDLFNRLPEKRRQEILFLERMIAGFATLNVPKLGTRLGCAFRGFGSFYTFRFLAAHEKFPSENADPCSRVLRQGAEEDLHRARFYLQKAIERNADDFAAINMLGYIALACQEPPDIEEARRQFMNSRTVQPAQQRAQYNLADIAYRFDHDHNRAIGLYREALTHVRWEYDPSPENTLYIRFNLGCVLTQKWDKETTNDSAEEALGLIEEVMKTGRTYIRDFLEKECMPGGDLVPLLNHPEYAVRLNAIRAL